MPKLIAVMPVKAIEKLQPIPGKHRKVAVAPFLYIHISPTGGRSWIFRFTVRGRKTDMGIGSAHTMTRDEAIERVAELQAMRRSGIDPLAARREAVTAGEAVADVPTFKACATEFHAANAITWSASHAAAWLRELEREVMPAIGHKPVDKIVVADVLKALSGWTTTHETTSRNRGRIECVLDYAKTRGHRSGENPAIWKGNLSNLLPSPKAIKKAKGEQHHDAMDWKVVPQFVAQLDDSDAARALKFLILTAGRSSEVRNAEWSEFDFEARTWTIPAAKMKARKEHVVALSGPALAIVDGIERKDEFVFGDLGRDSMRELCPDGSTPHGFRASFSTWAGEIGLARDTVEKCLAHTVGSAVERSYRRGAETEQKRQIMERWAMYLDGEQSGVVTLDARRA